VREKFLKNLSRLFAGVSEHSLILENVPEEAPGLIQFDLIQMHSMVFVPMCLTNRVVVDQLVNNFDFVSLTTIAAARVI
jgi:hypothetical protein